MKILVPLLCLASFTFGAEAGFMQEDTGKTLPKGVWLLSIKTQYSRYGVVVPAGHTAQFNMNMRMLVSKTCYGLLANLEACGEVPAEKGSSSPINTQLGWGLKYSPFYKPYFRGEFITSVSYRGWSATSESYPADWVIPGTKGTATMNYGSAHEAQLTMFASKNRFAVQGFGSYRANLRQDFFRLGDTICGGASAYGTPQDIKSENKIAFVADAWTCRQQSAEFGGTPFEGSRQIMAVGPGIVFTHGPHFGVKAAIGILLKKPQGLINKNPDLNDGVSLTVWVRK